MEPRLISDLSYTDTLHQQHSFWRERIISAMKESKLRFWYSILSKWTNLQKSIMFHENWLCWKCFFLVMSSLLEKQSLFWANELTYSEKCKERKHVEIPYGEALRKGTCTWLFAQRLVQWVLTWLCPLVAIAVQTFNNKEVASSARVKRSYWICIVSMPLWVLGWML